MSRNIRNRLALPLLACLLAPFVVGFDLPDSTGTYVKVASGRGAYHVSGCHRGYDSEIVEGHIAMRASLDTEGEGTTFWSRAQPKRTTLGVYGNFTSEELTLVDTSALGGGSPRIGEKSKDHGLAGGLYAGFDWTWIGLQVGLAGFSVLQQTEDVDNQGGSPALGLRLGRENLHVTAEAFGGAPLYTGGGLVQVGAGGRFGRTRLWAGLGTHPFQATMVSVKASQGLGPVSLFAAGMLGARALDGTGLEREHALSLGVEARIPGLP